MKREIKSNYREQEDTFGYGQPRLQLLVKNFTKISDEPAPRKKKKKNARCIDATTISRREEKKKKKIRRICKRSILLFGRKVDAWLENET